MATEAIKKDTIAAHSGGTAKGNDRIKVCVRVRPPRSPRADALFIFIPAWLRSTGLFPLAFALNVFATLLWGACVVAGGAEGTP